ncbi:DUF6074 family protein [Devosia sp. CN2-171]|uniref:DUF6074 family protein n=1 Tax=Devosia sp. CN2-171 TaxID=3400909 RepID=UPI003BF7C50E
MPHELLLFPIARDRRVVLALVSVLRAERTDRGRQTIWRVRMRTVERHLRQLGASEADIDRQISTLRAAVTAELTQRAS